MTRASLERRSIFLAALVLTLASCGTGNEQGVLPVSVAETRYCIFEYPERFVVAAQNENDDVGREPCDPPWRDVPVEGYEAAVSGNLWLIDRIPAAFQLPPVVVIRVTAGHTVVSGGELVVATRTVRVEETPVELLFIDVRVCAEATCQLVVATEQGRSEVSVNPDSPRPVRVTEYEEGE